MAQFFGGRSRELRRNHFHDSEIPKLSGYWCVVAQSYPGSCWAATRAEKGRTTWVETWGKAKGPEP